MINFNKNIIIIEPSFIVSEGLSTVIQLNLKSSIITQIQSFEQASTSLSKDNIDLIFINPLEIQNRTKEFNGLKKIHPNIKWIGIIYSLVDKNILSLFDETITITDTSTDLSEKFSRLISIEKLEIYQNETLSEREIDVLIQLVNGLSNKEIADKLNISIHTVISHRKNITQKTGIKSQSGLTIYAISNRIISLDNIQ